MRGTSALIGASLLTSLGLFGCGGEEKPNFSPALAIGGSGGAATGGRGNAMGGATGNAMGGAAGNAMGGAAGNAMGGAAAVGGAAGAPPVTCPSGSFISPASGATLTAAADATTDCSNGFQTTVSIGTSAPNGTLVTLFADNAQVATATVNGAAASFPGVQLNSNATIALSVQLGAAPECKVEIPVTVACSPVVCSITKPVISAVHPKLNGEAAPAGDRVSGNGSPYQVAFEVTTNVEDGQSVVLNIDNGAQSLAAPASGGVALFAGITLVPDGDHSAEATCTSLTGQTTKSGKPIFSVDTAAPDLAPSGIAGGQFFGPADDVDVNTPEVQFRVCGSTTSADGVDLSSTLGAAKDNFCVAVGAGSPACIAATTDGVSAGTNGGCLNVTCPGGAAFNLNLTLRDTAGNISAQTLTDVKCASTLPSVQIITPIPSVTNNIATNILAATAAQALKDADGAALGAQFVVEACTDTPGAAADLLSGLDGGTLAVIATATAVPAQLADNCPNNLGNIVRFPVAKLTESSALADGTLDKATELRVRATAVSTATNTSGPTLVWVDSVAPVIAPYIPNNLCSLQVNTATPPDTRSVTLKSVANQPLTLRVTRNSVSTDYVTTAAGADATFSAVVFGLGTNDVSSTFTEPSGNSGALTSPCRVTVGNVPVVTWISPAPSTTKLNLATDGGVAAGWQGQIQVKVETDSLPAAGVNVSFKLNNILVVQAITDAGGFATVASATLTDAQVATLLAETDSVPSFGVGSGSIGGLTIDTTKPSAVSSVAVSVPAAERRTTKMKLDWLAPSDGGATVALYDVRRSKTPITNMVQFAAATPVALSGLPQAPGASESVIASGMFIETDYYFAIVSVDAGGNTSDLTAAGPTRATFNVTILDDGSTTARERRIDGSASVDGDAFADLFVASQSGDSVGFYRGSATGYATTPSRVITGPLGFGPSVAVLGDVDGNGSLDVGVGSTTENKVYIFSRNDWTSTTALTNLDANYVISTDSVADPKMSGANFGVSISRLGDFNGDGAADFVVGAHRYETVLETGFNRSKGLAVIFLGTCPNNTDSIPPACKKAFPAALLIPQAFGTDAIEVRNESVLGFSSFFGQAVLGVGNLYDSSKTDLLVSAPFLNKVYSFQGTSSKSALLATSPTHSTTVAASSGGLTLSLLGRFSGNPGVGVGGLNNKPDLFFGNGSVGPFGATVSKFTNSAATNGGDAFGNAIIGGGFSGISTTVSLIADKIEPDIAFTGRAEGGITPPKLYIIRGSVANTGGDIVALADVTYALPVGWTGASSKSTPINDLNNDGFGDIAIGESRSGTYGGRVLVLW